MCFCLPLLHSSPSKSNYQTPSAWAKPNTDCSVAQEEKLADAVSAQIWLLCRERGSPLFASPRGGTELLRDLAAGSVWSWASPVCQTLLPKCNIYLEYSTNIMGFHPLLVSLASHSAVRCVSCGFSEPWFVYKCAYMMLLTITYRCCLKQTFPCSHHCGIKLNHIKICLTSVTLKRALKYYSLDCNIDTIYKM